MIALALATFVTPAFAEDACYLGPYSQFEVPVGCPLLVYQRRDEPAPIVAANRDEGLVDVTGKTDTLGLANVIVWHLGARPQDPQYEVFAKYSVTLDGVAAGDELVVGAWPLRVGPPGTCVDDLRVPQPVCRGAEAEVPVGCSAGGGAGLAAALGALALAMRRHRYDRRRRA